MSESLSVEPAFIAAAPHGVNKVSQVPLGYGLPLQLQQTQKLLEVARWWMVAANSVVQHIPDMFNGVQVVGFGRPVHSGDGRLPEKRIHRSGPVLSGIVVLEYCIWPDLW